MRARRASLGLIAAALLLSSLAAQAAEMAVVGTGDGLEMLKAIAARYSEREVRTTVSVPPSIGSGGGIAAVVSGRERMGRVARPLTDSERAEGIVYLPIARIPSVFFVNPKVPVDSLTSKQLGDVFGGRVTNWKDVGGPDQPIRVVRREEADSTLLVLRQTVTGWRDLALTPQSKTAITTQNAIESVAAVDGAIGFGPFSPSLAPAVRPIGIDGRDVTKADYPSAVTLALIYKQDKLDAEMKDFIGFVRSDDGRAVIRQFGAIPVSE